MCSAAQAIMSGMAEVGRLFNDNRLIVGCGFVSLGLAAIFWALRSGWSERLVDPALTAAPFFLKPLLTQGEGFGADRLGLGHIYTEGGHSDLDWVKRIFHASAFISHWARRQQRMRKKCLSSRAFMVTTILVSAALGSKNRASSCACVPNACSRRRSQAFGKDATPAKA